MRRTRSSVARVDQLAVALGPPPWSLTQLRDAGWTDAAVRAAVTGGRLVRPRRGVVSLPGAAQADPCHDIRAALLVCGPDAVVSHDSAVRWHELWRPRVMSPLVHLTIPGEPGRTDRGLRVHRSTLAEHHVTTSAGVQITTVARTVADAARGRGLNDAVTLLDSAARRILTAEHGVPVLVLRDEVGREQRRELALGVLTEAADAVAGWPGSGVLVRALAELEPASESPFESWSRMWIRACGLPRPCVALAVRGASGRDYSADFGWPARRVLGEADGIGKYGTEPAAVARALRAERRRQRDLEDAGWTVVRWDSTEHPRAVVRRLGVALGTVG